MTIRSLRGHAAVAEQAQAMIGQRRAQQVARELLEALAIVLPHHGGDLENEAVHARLQLAGVRRAIGVLGAMRGGALPARRAREGASESTLLHFAVLERASLEHPRGAGGGGVALVIARSTMNV